MTAREAPREIHTDVFIAGSGPLGCTFARTIIDKHTTAKVHMFEIGSQDGQVTGRHHKNSVKYQRDIDAFVNVIKGALQPVSVPSGSTFNPTLSPISWSPTPQKPLIASGSNPYQEPEFNLGAFAVTRTVGGMATHWTCACPLPAPEERSQCPIPSVEFDRHLTRGIELLGVRTTEFDDSIRHNTVKDTLNKAYGPSRPFTNLPLAAKRNTDNKDLVTWTGCDIVLGETTKNPRFTLSPEHRVTKLHYEGGKIVGALVRNLVDDNDYIIKAKVYIVACGAVSTPQLLFNSNIRPVALGRYLCEQSIAFCQIVFKRTIVDAIAKDPRWAEKVKHHQETAPMDPLPIPFLDPEPQVTTRFKYPEHPWHTQIHRDAFSYGATAWRADSRTVVDLRYFGRQEVDRENRVEFADDIQPTDQGGIILPGQKDIYGMPQATFHVSRSQKDAEDDHRMMLDMCEAANKLGGFIPGSEPQFMEPGLALHVTGTTRAGKDSKTSVVDANSRVHGIPNLWLGGNSVIPDSTSCNPTLTSVAYALHASEDIITYLGR